MLSLSLDKAQYVEGEEMLLTVTAVLPEPTRVLVNGRVVSYAGDWEIWTKDAAREWTFVAASATSLQFRSRFSGEGGAVVVSMSRFGGQESATATYLSVPPTLEIERSFQVGWCPPNSTVTEYAAMMKKYPGTKIHRLYSATTLQPWTSGILSMVPKDVTLCYSFKTFTPGPLGNPGTVSEWLSARPKGLLPFYLTLDHEPEQQEGGDPTPAELQAEWKAITAELKDHPRRAEIKLMPIFTEYAATKGGNAATWERDFGIVSSYEGIDAVGFDIYNTGYPSYRTPQQMFSFALSHARKHKVPAVLIGELGIDRKGTDASGTNAGTKCAQVMKDNVDYFASQPEARGVMWFYRGGQNLDTRLPEQQALRDLIAQYQ